MYLFTSSFSQLFIFHNDLYMAVLRKVINVFVVPFKEYQMYYSSWVLDSQNNLVIVLTVSPNIPSTFGLISKPSTASFQWVFCTSNYT